MSANIQSQATVNYDFSIDEKVIKSASAVETHFLRVEARMKSGSEVMSRQLLNLKGNVFDYFEN